MSFFSQENLSLQTFYSESISIRIQSINLFKTSGMHFIRYNNKFMDKLTHDSSLTKVSSNFFSIKIDY